MLKFRFDLIVLFLIVLFLVISCNGKSRLKTNDEKVLAQYTTETPTTETPTTETLTTEEPLIQLLNGETYWAALFIDGKKSGYTRTVRAVLDDKVTTQILLNMTMKRGIVNISMESIIETIETVSGKPLNYRSQTTGTGMNKRAWGKFGDNGKLHIITKTFGTTTKKEIDWPEDAIMYEGIRLDLIKHGTEEGMAFKSKIFEVSSAEVLNTETVIKKTEEIDLLGRVVKATRFDTIMHTSGGPMNVSTWTDSNLIELKSQVPMMGLMMETVACEEAYALSENNPAEIFSSAFIDSPKPILKEQLNSKILYQITPSSIDKELRFLTSVEQNTEKGEKGKSFNIEVTVKDLPLGELLPYAGNNKEAIEALFSNNWIQSDAGKIIALAKQAVKNEKDAAKAAKKIEKFVSKYIDGRTLQVGYATALEVATSKQGDCSEFALLTAAMCQAVGIPARVVFGFVYVADMYAGKKDFFGGHAWTQVFLNEKWYSLDAAQNGFNAGHIALSVGDGAPSNFFDVINTLGYFKITSVK